MRQRRTLSRQNSSLALQNCFCQCNGEFAKWLLTLSEYFHHRWKDIKDARKRIVGLQFSVQIRSCNFMRVFYSDDKGKSLSSSLSICLKYIFNQEKHPLLLFWKHWRLLRCLSSAQFARRSGRLERTALRGNTASLYSLWKCQFWQGYLLMERKIDSSQIRSRRTISSSVTYYTLFVHRQWGY